MHLANGGFVETFVKRSTSLALVMAFGSEPKRTQIKHGDIYRLHSLTVPFTPTNTHLRT